MAGIADDLIRALDSIEARQAREQQQAQSTEMQQLNQMFKMLQIQEMIEEQRRLTPQEVENFSKISQEDRKLDIEASKVAAEAAGQKAEARQQEAAGIARKPPGLAAVGAQLGAGVRAPSVFAGLNRRQAEDQLRASQAGERLGQGERRLTFQEEEAERRQRRFETREQRISEQFALNFRQREDSLDILRERAITDVERAFVSELDKRGRNMEKAAVRIQEGLDTGRFPTPLVRRIRGLLPGGMSDKYPTIDLGTAERLLSDLEDELLNIPSEFPSVRETPIPRAPRGGGPRKRKGRTKTANEIDALLDAE